MGNQQIEYEIDKRIKSELWDLEIAKKVNKKYYIYKLKNNIKIASFILLISLSVWDFVHRNDQKKRAIRDSNKSLLSISFSDRAISILRRMIFSF